MTQTSHSVTPGGTGESGGPATVLLRGPTEETWGPIWDQRDPRTMNVLAITTRLDPLEWVDGCEQQLGELPVKTGAIRIGTPIDPATTPTQPSHETVDLPLTAVERPSDLAELYTAINLYITEWLHTDQQTVIWLESLTPVIEHVGAKRTITFVEALAERLRMTGAVAYARIDPRDHDDHTLSMIGNAFDQVVETERSDQVTADSREERVLRTLRTAGELSIETLAGRVAASGNARHPEGRDPVNARLVAIDLYHASLPKLADDGLIAVDWGERAAELAVEPGRVDGLLARRSRRGG